EAERHAEVEERPLERDARMSADVPRVAPAVAVRVLEVVRGPGIRGEHDGDAVRAELPRADHERRIADSAVGRRRAQEVEAARPVARAHDAKERRRVAMAAPIHRDRSRLRESGRLHVLLAWTT